MKRKIMGATLSLLTGTLLAASTLAAQQSSWVHLRVQDGEGGQMSVDLPLPLVEIAMSMVERKAGEEAGGALDVEMGEDVGLEDLRLMWNELRDAGNAEFFRAEEEGEQIRIYREGERVFFQADEEEKTVRIQVPVAVVDALLEGEGESLNLVGAMRELARAGNEDFVEIREGEKTVRAWVDSERGGE